MPHGAAAGAELRRQWEALGDGFTHERVRLFVPSPGDSVTAVGTITRWEALGDGFTHVRGQAGASAPGASALADTAMGAPSPWEALGAGFTHPWARTAAPTPAYGVAGDGRAGQATRSRVLEAHAGAARKLGVDDAYERDVAPPAKRVAVATGSGARPIGATTAAVKAAVDAAVAARSSLKQTRDATVSLARAGAGALWAVLTGAEMTAALAALSLHVGARGRDPIALRYEEFCAGKLLRAYPLSRASVGSYFAHYVFVKQNKSSMLGKLLSALRCYCRLRDPGSWLPALDEEQVRVDITALQLHAPAQRDSTPTLSCLQLVAAVRVAKAEGTAHGRLAAVLLTLLPGLQARGTEVFGDGVLTFRDIAFDKYGLLVEGYLDKSAQREIRVRPKAALHFPIELHELCASKALREHFVGDSTWDSSWANDPVRKFFPVLSQLKRCSTSGRWTCSSTPLTSTDAKALLLHYLALAGVPDVGLDIHFGRPSGTELYEYELRLCYDMIEALGGWAPTTTLSTFYQKHSPARMAQLAAEMVRDRFPAGVAMCCGTL